MYEERFTAPHKQGLERFNNGDNAGRFFCHERTEQVTDPDTNEERTEYIYDVYEVSDCRDPHKVKNEVINEEHPFGDELKILRKTIRKTAYQLNSCRYKVWDSCNKHIYRLSKKIRYHWQGSWQYRHNGLDCTTNRIKNNRNILILPIL